MKVRWPHPEFEPTDDWALREPIGAWRAERGLAHNDYPIDLCLIERHRKLEWLARRLGIDLDNDPNAGYVLAFMLALCFIPGFQSAPTTKRPGRPKSAGLEKVADWELAALADAIKAVRPAETDRSIAKMFAMAGDNSLKKTTALASATKTVRNRIAKGRTAMRTKLIR